MLASLDSWKTISDIVSNAFTISAIGIGAIWAYWRFVRERTRWPRAVLELVVTNRTLTPEKTLLNATVKVRNAGSGLMRLTGLRVYIYRVLPFDQGVDLTSLVSKGNAEANWPCIAKHTRDWKQSSTPEIEPQENDEYVHDFLIPSHVETVFIYAFVENVKKARGSKELGWQVTAFYDLGDVTGERRVTNLVTGEGDEQPTHRATATAARAGTEEAGGATEAGTKRTRGA